MFQKLDLPRQGRLGHIHARGGAAEMQFLGGGDKTAKLAQFELGPEGWACHGPTL
jgi:hypothetical protein